MSNNKPSNLKAPSKLTKPTTTSFAKPGGITQKTSSSSPSGVLTENTDDFIIGNRVWVGGTKPGYIQYIGETQFAPGEWAGVVLDDAIGKNDGSVAGVRYFQCEPKRGVFSRLSKLTLYPVPHLMQAEGLDLPSDDGSSIKANGSVRSISPRPGSSARLPSRSSTPSSLYGTEATRNLNIGERVQVTSASGIKNGTLRYLGSTDFAEGEWAGVELDNATGKNDGAVNGKRYFNCPMKYGLFAPIHKVSKPSSASIRRTTASTPSPLKRIGAIPKRIGSQDSVNTIGSAASSVRSTKPRLGITSLTSSSTPSRSSATNITATHTAMQGALKEKEQHIEQLLKERDMERNEMVRAATQVEDAERILASLKTEYENHKEDSTKTISKLKEVIESTDRQLQETNLQLEEERKKVEDLQFRVEEESINKSDLEQTAKKSQTSKEADVERIRELEGLLKSETARVEKLEQENNLNFQNEEEMLTKHLAELEDFKEKLRRAEDTIRSLEAAKVFEGSKASQVSEELVRRDTKISKLESLVRNFEQSESNTTKKIATLEEELVKKDCDRSLKEGTINELYSKVASLETEISKSTKVVEEMQISNSDLQRRLKGTEERLEGVVEQKTKLEAEIDEVMKSSGDNSAQLVKINEQLREKERSVESLRLELQVQKQEAQKMEDVQEQQESRHRREIETLGTKHWEEVTSLETILKASQEDVKNLKEKFKSREDENTRTLDVLKQKQELEVREMRREMEERCKQMKELVDALEEERKIGEEGKKSVQELRDGLGRELSQKQSQLESALKEKSEANASREKLETLRLEQDQRIADLVAEKKKHESAVIERDQHVAALTAEVTRIKEELERHHIDLKRKLAETVLDKDAVQNMRNQSDLQQKQLEEVQESLIKAQDKNALLLKEIEKNKTASTSKKDEFEAAISKLEKQMDEMKNREVQTKENYDNEKETLQKMLETTQMLLEQKDKDLERHQTEIGTLKKDISSNDSEFKVEVQKLKQENCRLEREKTALDNKLSQLEADHQSRAATKTVVESVVADLAMQKTIDEKDGQIEFLNSVIVDMQKKKDELISRIQILEMGDLISDSSDVNLNAINASAVPPRLFCDICDAFDMHDTEDCPKQETSEGPPPTQYHGTRQQERPYCDICEVFGHWTNECDDNETF